MDKNVQAGINEAQVLVRSGEPKAALELLLALRSSAESNLELDLNLAMIYRQLGKLSEAVAALDRVLAQDPYSFIALLSKGSIFEQLGSVRRAGEIYKNALKIAPPANRLPSSLLGPIEQAQSLVQAQNTLLYQDLKSHIDGLRTGLSHYIGLWIGRVNHWCVLRKRRYREEAGNRRLVQLCRLSSVCGRSRALCHEHQWRCFFGRAQR